MYRITKYIFLSFLVIFLSACGTTEDDTQSVTVSSESSSSSDDNYDYYTPTQPPVVSPPLMQPASVTTGLNDWRKPRVYAKTKILDSCNGESVFSLRPHKNTLEAIFVDYTMPTIYPDGYSLIAVQTRDTTFSIPLQYNSATHKWSKECATVKYVDKNDIYPTYLIRAVNDANGSIVTEEKVVMFDGGTENCKACHASNSAYPLAYPSSGAVNLADAEADYKTNILALHDQKHPNAVSGLLSLLEAKGKMYDTAGLVATSQSTRVTCTDCHGINAVQASGFKNVPALTNAIHDVHANLSEPNITGPNNCLTCHPGETITKTFNGKIVHPFTDAWKDEDGHGEWSENNGVSSCTLCHGMDLRGTKISNNVSCYKCHGKEW
ncbi:hypothetical protein FJR45_03535 [Sulfurimonas sediminis]|uniref:Cytochrome C n=1 Tax=Sulfurimonas sediminis TaxID=2590020 RepID=A0A7M1B047_9BACT|nr:hypothetical protein [Sulfurimonas sediminis]QOP43074.1 hypothetical protein FJR45_03535 [Sulfurimonas sediminis]